MRSGQKSKPMTARPSERWKPLLWAAVLTAWLLCLSPIPAASADGVLEDLRVSVRPLGEDLPSRPDAVAWMKQKGREYILPLPGGTDWNVLRIWFTGVEEIQVDGAPFHSGDSVSGWAPGQTVRIRDEEKEYQLLLLQGSAIGAVFVQTGTGSMEEIDADTRYKEEGGRLLCLNPDGSAAYDGAMAHFKLRGNTSATLDKKNYGFKLEDGADLAGLGKAKRWVLIGNGRDLSLLRNQICLDLARFAGLMYTPDTAPVDLYLNHRYHGCYLLSEKIEVNPDRVDLFDLEKANEEANPEPLESYPRVGKIKTYKRGKYKAFALPNNPADITGGYILEYENYQPRYGTEWCAYVTDRSKVFLFKEPEIASVEEMEYAVSYMQGYEDAIFSADGRNPDTGKAYWEYVDFDSLVRKYMLEEVSMNTDGNGSSQLYFKPADSVSTVFFAGPAWDYDATLASFSARSVQDRFLDPERLLLTTVSKSRYYWPQLYAREEFREAVRGVWSSDYAPGLRVLLGREKDPADRLRSVEEYASRIADSAAMNFLRWPISTGKNAKRTGRTWDANIRYLQDILTRRYAFLENTWGPGASD